MSRYSYTKNRPISPKNPVKTLTPAEFYDIINSVKTCAKGMVIYNGK